VLRGGKLRAALATLAVMAAFLGVAAIPAASAADCTVTVTLLTGQVLYFQLPQGAPLSSLNITQPVKSITESCPQAPTPTVTTPTTPTVTTPTTTTTSTSTTSSSTTPTNSTSTPTSSSNTTSPGSRKGSTSTSGSGSSQSGPPQSSGGSAQPGSHHGATSGSAKAKSHEGKTAPVKTPPTIGPGGIPTPANPTFSFALPGPAPIGVPNFFIESFRIPPFLLPIYQAAGIEYNVPWQVLAAINEIETDYGRNLSVSTAGAVGWMQFLPSTWKQWGLDANGDGVADPYNPVDAIFSAARYLHAAGASSNLPQAIFAYNHASWYVESVLLRAKLIGGLPNEFVNAITGLVQADFPVAAQAKYADDSVVARAKDRVKGSNAAVPVASDHSKTVSIFAKKGSPVIAVNDGKIVAIGQNAKLGRYVELQDATGNIFTYAHLGSLTHLYPVPKPVHVTAAQITKELSVVITPKPSAPASAGTQTHAVHLTTKQATRKAASAAPISLPVSPAPAAAPATISAPLVKERLFANPTRPASYAAGGALQLKSIGPALTSFQNYFSEVLHLGKNQYTLKPLRKGSIVIAGTILGRIAAGTPQLASHVDFMIRPAGKDAPYIDPKPILDGWKLLEATAVYRAAGVNPFVGPAAKNPTIGQILLMSKEQLQNRVLNDPHVAIYACGRRDVQDGAIDRRVLATIEFLSASGLDPTISGLECGHSLTGSTGVDAAGATGSSMDISAINNVPVLGHQGPGSIVDLAIRRLLTLQGAMKPNEIVSLMSYKGQNNTLSLPDHADRIQVAFTPLFGENKKLSTEIKSILQPNQWIDLINRIGQIPEPLVPISPSQYAIKVPGH